MKQTHYFKSLRIKNQLFIIQMTTFIVVSLVITTIYMVNRDQISHLVSSIIIDVQNSLIFSSLDIQSNILLYQINSLYQGKQQKLNSLFKLYQYLEQKTDMILNDDLFFTPPFEITYDNISYNDFPYFCSAAYNSNDLNKVPTEKQTQTMVKLSQTLNLMLVGIQNQGTTDQKLYFTTTYDNQLFGINPMIERADTYRPHIRDWYQNYINFVKMNSSINFQLTDPFMGYVSKKKQISILTSLESVSGELQGVVGTDYSLIQLKLFEQYQFINIIVVDTNGKIIISDREELIKNQTSVEDAYYLYDSQVTGFDKEDWKQIMQQSNNKNGTSNCINTLDKFCRYNSLSRRNLFIYSYLLENKYYFITLITLDYLEETTNQSKKVSQQITNEITKTLIIFGCCGISLILISYLYMKISIKPYEQMTQILGYQLNPDSKYSKRQMRNDRSIFSKIGIEKFYQKLQTKAKHKSYECLKIESFTYPRFLLSEDDELQNDKLKINFKTFSNYSNDYQSKQSLQIDVFKIYRSMYDIDSNVKQ